MFTPPTVVDVQPGYPIGATQPGYFRTETGCSVLSSFESMSPTLSESNWGIHSAPFHERNYPCDPIILSYFGAINLNLTGADSFKKQLYLCMLGQGIQRKTDIESWRSGNVWGTLMWQLAEIWPTGGWGSLEFVLLPRLLTSSSFFFGFLSFFFLCGDICVIDVTRLGIWATNRISGTAPPSNRAR